MNKLTLSGIVILATLLSGCATTRFESTWMEPGVGPIDMSAKKVAAVLVSSSEATRRAAEDALAQELTKRGAMGVPGYSLIPVSKPMDADEALEVLAGKRISNAVVMRIVNSEKETYYVPGTMWYPDPYYRSFHGYWGTTWPLVYDPGYYRTDTLVSVETLLYSVPDGKLIWSGISKTTNPTKIESLVREIVNAAAKEMKKSGLIGCPTC